MPKRLHTNSGAQINVKLQMDEEGAMSTQYLKKLKQVTMQEALRILTSSPSSQLGPSHSFAHTYKRWVSLVEGIDTLQQVE